MTIDLDKFEDFGKIPRYARGIVISEKIDGTNAQVCINEKGEMKVGSRNRWITPQQDNYGFARWAEENKEELLKLGVGRHFGEWWGSGIQRGYGLSEKRFSLFNAGRWSDFATRPRCCDVVPVIIAGEFNDNTVAYAMNKLHTEGSLAAPGYMKPEGIVIYHKASNGLFKKTLDDDDISKTEAEKRLKVQGSREFFLNPKVFFRKLLTGTL